MVTGKVDLAPPERDGIGSYGTLEKEEELSDRGEVRAEVMRQEMAGR